MARNDDNRSYEERKKAFKDSYNKQRGGILTAQGAWELHQRQEARRDRNNPYKNGEMYPPNPGR